MTLTHEPTHKPIHEPIPVHHLADYDPEGREELTAIGGALLRQTMRMGVLAKGSRPRSTDETVLSTRLDVATEAGQVATPESRETPSTQEITEVIWRLVVDKGADGMTVDEFHELMTARGIDLQANDTLQALVYGLNEGIFTLVDSKIIAFQETQDV